MSSFDWSVVLTAVVSWVSPGLCYSSCCLNSTRRSWRRAARAATERPGDEQPIFATFPNHVEAYGESDMSRVMLFFNSKLGKHRTQIAIYSRWRKKVRPVYAAGLW